MVFVRFKILNACRRCRAAAPRQRFSKDYWLGCLFCLREGEREFTDCHKTQKSKSGTKIQTPGPHPTAASQLTLELWVEIAKGQVFGSRRVIFRSWATFGLSMVLELLVG
jgi:hypothetical protein